MQNVKLRHVCCMLSRSSCVQLCDPMDHGCQAPLSMSDRTLAVLLGQAYFLLTPFSPIHPLPKDELNQSLHLPQLSPSFLVRIKPEKVCKPFSQSLACHNVIVHSLNSSLLSTWSVPVSILGVQTRGVLALPKGVSK